MKYIAYFDIPEYSNEQRSVNLAGINVMAYMTQIFNKYRNIEIISPARTLAKEGKFKARTIELNKRTTLRLPSTFGTKTRIGRYISLFHNQLWLLCILLFECKYKETIIVYHSPSLMRLLKYVQIIKHFNFILEVREIYSDVHSKIREKEEISFFNIASRYIFATKQLNDKINVLNKPSIIAPGIYISEIRSTTTKWDDDIIHLVYAGNFGKKKGGVEASINIAEYLSEKYVIHILGSGDKNTMEYVNKLIAIQNSKNGAKVIYEGVLRGSEFKTFLQKCDIGLSTQNPSETFNLSSFPSKILTYLSNGLEVISAKIPAVTDSPIGKYIHYYDKHDSQSIANSVLQIKESLNSKELLNILHENLIKDFDGFLD